VEIKEAIRSALKELILPELESIKVENREIKTVLSMTNKRLDDVNVHLVDLSRRLDETNKRIDETKDFLLARIDETRDFLLAKIDETNKRIDNTNSRIDETNKALNRLYEVIVRREEHEKLDLRVMKLEEEVKLLKEKIAT